MVQLRGRHDKASSSRHRPREALHQGHRFAPLATHTQRPRYKRRAKLPDGDCRLLVRAALIWGQCHQCEVRAIARNVSGGAGFGERPLGDVDIGRVWREGDREW
jgi:ABC-type phosphonate transport system ATPase subunit